MNSSSKFMIMANRCNLKSNCAAEEEKINQDENKRTRIHYPAIYNGSLIKKVFKIILEGKGIAFEDNITIHDSHQIH